jgi:nitronate monooxygenase
VIPLLCVLSIGVATIAVSRSHSAASDANREHSDVGPEHVALLLETKPEVVSFHFGLPEPQVIRALKSAGIFILSSATTVVEARLLEQQGVDAIIARHCA